VVGGFHAVALKWYLTLIDFAICETIERTDRECPAPMLARIGCSVEARELLP
jgi:hypothetical protein